MADKDLEARVAALERQVRELVQIVDAIVAPTSEGGLEAYVAAAKARRRK
jgi:hypothetical protein